MKRIGFLLLIVLAMILVVGCSNNDNDNTENQPNNSSTNNNEAANNSEDNDEEELLSLGDTGVHETTIGDYEVTPTAFEILESVDGVEPDNKNFNFIIVDVTVKNIGDTVLDGKEVAKIDLRDAEDFVRSNKKQYDFVNHFEGDIQPGEEVEGQFIFTSLPDLEYYDLIFGLHRSGVANELTWRFTQDDLE